MAAGSVHSAVALSDGSVWLAGRTESARFSRKSGVSKFYIEAMEKARGRGPAGPSPLAPLARQRLCVPLQCDEAPAKAARTHARTHARSRLRRPNAADAAAQLELPLRPAA